MSTGPDPLTNASGGPKTPGTTSVSSLFTWLGTRGDYSSIDRRDKALTGWRRHFSTVTKEGRFNIVVVTYLLTGIGALYMWKRYRDSKVDATAAISTK